jgi:hypothetical protein
LGPWETHPVKSGQPFVASIGFPVGHCYTERQLANAKLISSAPELLAALETSLEWLESAKAEEPEDCENPALGAAIEQARAAIAKAKGTR